MLIKFLENIIKTLYVILFFILETLMCRFEAKGIWSPVALFITFRSFLLFLLFVNYGDGKRVKCVCASFFEPNSSSFLQNSLFLSFSLVWPLLLNNFRSRGLLFHLLGLCHTHTHTHIHTHKHTHTNTHTHTH